MVILNYTLRTLNNYEKWIPLRLTNQKNFKPVKDYFFSHDLCFVPFQKHIKEVFLFYFRRVIKYVSQL